MITIHLVLVACAVVCFALKALGFKREPFDLTAAGFAFLSASLLPSLMDALP